MAEINITGPCAPVFIVSDILKSLDYYIENLGFECIYKSDEKTPVSAVIGRGTAHIMLKSKGDDLKVTPNSDGCDDVLWDAYILTTNPDVLHEEFTIRGASFPRTLKIYDGLQGFETIDADGYVCFFGKPN